MAPKEINLQLGSLLDEIKRHETDETVCGFLEWLLNYEKGDPNSYVAEIRERLAQEAGE